MSGPALASARRLTVMRRMLATSLVLVLSVAAATALCAWLMPTQRDLLAHWPWWQMLAVLLVAVLLVADNLTQYFWHRLSHTSIIWPLHRAHHSAAYMSVRVVYRNNAFYYALMPELWLSGVLLFLGFGWVYVAYTIVKLTVIIGAHSGDRGAEVVDHHADAFLGHQQREIAADAAAGTGNHRNLAFHHAVHAYSPFEPSSGPLPALSRVASAERSRASVSGTRSRHRPAAAVIASLLVSEQQTGKPRGMCCANYLPTMPIE